MNHGYKCSSKWYRDRDARLIEDYRRFGLALAAERAGLSVEMARAGVFPPGIILQAPGGVPCVIKGAYETNQVAVPLEAK